jgi:hypothetical protein
LPAIAVIFGMTILLYYDDHDPPHFHVKAADFSAKIDLGDLAVLEASGRLCTRDLARLRRWATRHRAALYDNWNRARRGERLLKIEGSR